ncbi:MAG: hypothetical protein Q8O87_00520 [bacterium]|nr:hypothetical protein [bacterium]
MTIIKPNNKIRFSPVLIFLIIGIVLGVLANIYFYNKNVDLTYLLSDQELYLKELEVLNAEKKNELYVVVDDASLGEVVDKLGLVKDNKPEYFKSQGTTLAALSN